MESQLEVTIVVEGMEKTYKTTYDRLHNHDWNEDIRELLDEASKLYK